MVRVSIDPEVAGKFRGIALAWTVVEGVEIPPRDAPQTQAVREAAEAEVRAERTAESLKDHRVFRAYRDFYSGIGIDPTKTRPAGEALNRRVVNGGRLPAINGFVDAYNVASLETGLAIGAYDADRLDGDLVLRFAEPGETFRPIGSSDLALDGGEIVLADAKRVVNFYPYRDADVTKILLTTTRGVLVACGVPKLKPNDLRGATRRASHHVRDLCGGEETGGGMVGL